MGMEKKNWQFLLIFAFALAILFGLPLNLYPASASIFTSEGNEKYEIQINDFGCEITDYEVNLDLWHFSVAGSYTVMLNNSGDTDVSIRWNEGNGDTTTFRENEVVIPPKTVKKYSVNFSFHLLSRDFSYEYKGI